MKHPLFDLMGDDYPIHLEQQFDRILSKIESLWDTPDIHDYFSDLLIDKRGGRQGFPQEVLNEIIRLREFRELETLRQAETKEDAIDALNEMGITLNRNNYLHALHKGDREVVDLFVRANFNVQSPDEDGTPPILVALKKGYTVVAQILLKAGADVNGKDRLGLTPLLVACGKPTIGYRAIAEALVMKGAFINIRDRLGYTPLLLALSGGTVEVAELLIERGADLAARTRDGQTALSLAEKAGNTHIVELLKEKGATA